MKRVFLYVRVSTEEQAIHGLSIGAQTAALEEWARTNGHKVVGIYTDAGISARKPAKKRPELQRLLADVQAGKGELIVFTKLDRWFRNIAEYYKVQEVLEKHHVDWRTIHEDYDTSTASGRLKINIMLSVAQDEADRTSERIKIVFDAKRDKLEAVTGKTPLGYKIEGKKIIKDPETEPAVNEFFRSYLASGSIAEAQRNTMERYGMAINYLAAHRMLDNPAYHGHYFGVDGMTPPYLSDEEFKKIQSMRNRVVRKTTKNRIFLFSGLVFCGKCGFRMAARSSTQSVEYRYYNCRRRYENVSSCENRVNINERDIESYLLDRLEEAIRLEKFKYEKHKQSQKVINYKPEIAAIRGKMLRLKELYVNELISMDEYKADHAAYTARLNELLGKDKAPQPPNFERLESITVEGWRERYEELGREDKREIWRSIIRTIRVYPDRRIEFDLNV